MAKPKILIADDDVAVMSTLALHLRNEEYEVVSVSDGIEALELARAERPDLLLVGLYLAAGERYMLYERLGEFPELLNIPLIYLVGKPRGSRTTPKLPEHIVVRKPVATTDLLPKIEAALHSVAATTTLAGTPEAAA